MAVIIPFSGDTPDATANAIARGSATIPTIIPENKSLVKSCLEYPFFNTVNSFGLNVDFTILLYSL